MKEKNKFKAASECITAKCALAVIGITSLGLSSAVST